MTTGISWHDKGKPFWILMKQEMTARQQHQQDHMQAGWVLFLTPSQ